MDDDMDAEYNLYWETHRFLESEELESWGFDEAFSGGGGGGDYDSSSPEGGVSSSSTAAQKNIAMERNRRRKLNEKLYALRSVVPNITKMDKASIIRDAIEYIERLQEEEKRLEAEMKESERASSSSSSATELTKCDIFPQKKKRTSAQFSASSPTSPKEPIELLELRVCDMGEKTMVVSITCYKKRDTMMRLCEGFESLNLKIITANLTCLAGTILHTLFVEEDNMNCGQLKGKIEAAIAQHDAETTTTTTTSPMSY